MQQPQKIEDLCGAEIIWPLILEINEVAFSLKQFQDETGTRVCKEKNITITIPSRGLVSLDAKRNHTKRKRHTYSIHYKLIPYMRLKAECDYATAIQ